MEYRIVLNKRLCVETETQMGPGSPLAENGRFSAAFFSFFTHVTYFWGPFHQNLGVCSLKGLKESLFKQERLFSMSNKMRDVSRSIENLPCI